MDASEIYRESFVWDDHGGFELQPDLPLDPLLAPWREAGVDYLSINVAYDAQPWFQATLNIAALRRRLPMEAPYCRIVASLGDIDSARAAGKIAVTFDIEGMNALHGRIDLVQEFYRDLWAKAAAMHADGVDEMKAAETIDLTNHTEIPIRQVGTSPVTIRRIYHRLDNPD